MFHWGFKHSKTIKALGLQPRAFISFLMFETPMKHLHSFLKYYLNNWVLSISIKLLSTLCQRIYALVRSVLEYACVTWSTSLPIYTKDKIERVQKRALRILFPALSYRDAILAANSTRLNVRRDELCIIIWKRRLKYENTLTVSAHTTLEKFKNNNHWSFWI